MDKLCNSQDGQSLVALVTFSAEECLVSVNSIAINDKS